MILLESQGRMEYQNGKFFRKKEILTLEKKMKMKISNFLTEIDVAWKKSFGICFILFLFLKN